MLQIQPATVRTQVERIVGRSCAPAGPSGAMPLTSHAKKMLELSSREAVRLGHNDIGTEHVLLGMVREGQGAAAQVLVSLGADLPRLRRTVVELATTLGAQRERVRRYDTTTEEDDETELERRSTITAAELLSHDEPAPLGTAATLPRDGRTAPRRRAERIPTGSQSTRGRSAESVEHTESLDDSDVISVFEPRRVVRPARSARTSSPCGSDGAS